MKFKMSEKSLFATLLRSPWWVSFLVMLGVAVVAGALLPEAYKMAGILGGFPFLVIGVIAAWRQRNALSAERIIELTEQARSMVWADFADLTEVAFRQQGFGVSRPKTGLVDFEIEKNGLMTLVSAKRWKAATVGAESVRALLSARESQDADGCSFISLGQFSQAALDLAGENSVQLMGPTQIAQLLHDGAKATRH
jgi:restriction system protein